MWRFFITVFSVLFFFNVANSQTLKLRGKLIEPDFKFLEVFLNDVFNKQTTIKKIPVYHNGKFLFKAYKNKVPSAGEIDLIFELGGAKYTNPISCQDVFRYKTNTINSRKVQFYYTRNSCESINDDYDVFLRNVINSFSQKYGGIPDLNVIFVKSKPLITMKTKIESGKSLIHQSIVGECKSNYPCTLYVKVDGVLNSKIYLKNSNSEWASYINLNKSSSNLSVYAVSIYNDTSDVVEFYNLNRKYLDNNSIQFVHPGEMIGDNVFSDIALKCNHLSSNGFYSFQFLIDSDMILDSLSFNLFDVETNKLIAKSDFINSAESDYLQLAESENGYKKLCYYMQYTKLNYPTRQGFDPCSIDDSRQFKFFLDYKLENGKNLVSSKKTVYFESFNEHIDNKPCNCE